MINIKHWYVAPVLIFTQACGGGGSGSSILSDEGSGGACDNLFHQEVLGRYTGIATYPKEQEAIAAGGSCSWDIDMTFRVSNDVGLCFLDVVVEAPVTQDVVLASDDPSIRQCFDESSVHDVTDNASSDSTPDVPSAISYPQFIDVVPLSGFPFSGPYFDDPSITARHIYLLDGPNAPLRSMQVNGDGTIDLQGVAISGTLTKEISQ